MCALAQIAFPRSNVIVNCKSDAANICLKKCTTLPGYTHYVSDNHSKQKRPPKNLQRTSLVVLLATNSLNNSLLHNILDAPTWWLHTKLSNV